MHPTIRYVVSVIVAVVVTLAAFYLMHRLISGNADDASVNEPPPGIRFGPVEVDENVQTRDRRKPPPPPPPDRPPPPPQMEIAQMEAQALDMPDLDLSNLDLGLSMQGTGPALTNLSNFNRNEDGDVIPLVRIQPQYPRSAAMNFVEGYVTIEFTIDETGAVRDPRVIDSNPPRIFDRAALRAIVRWKFKPRVEDGVATTRTATQTIEFYLDALQ
jgi:protein TonB